MRFASSAEHQPARLIGREKALRSFDLPLGVYQLPIKVMTPTAKGLSNIPMRKRSAKTCFVDWTAAKQNVIIVHKNSTAGR
jgi:hypothetical protein